MRSLGQMGGCKGPSAGKHLGRQGRPNTVEGTRLHTGRKGEKIMERQPLEEFADAKKTVEAVGGAVEKVKGEQGANGAERRSPA